MTESRNALCDLTKKKLRINQLPARKLISGARNLRIENGQPILLTEKKELLSHP